MKRSTDRIITSHAGSLYGTPALLDLMKGQRPGTAPAGLCVHQPKEQPMSVSMILLIVLILILIGSVPAWPYSRSWGYGPSGVVGAIVLVLVILWLMGRL